MQHVFAVQSRSVSVSVWHKAMMNNILSDIVISLFGGFIFKISYYDTFFHDKEFAEVEILLK